MNRWRRLVARAAAPGAGAAPRQTARLLPPAASRHLHSHTPFFGAAFGACRGASMAAGGKVAWVVSGCGANTR